VDGGYAEYALALAADVARKPEGLDHVRAAALPVASLTAWQALFDTAALAAGKKVLIWLDKKAVDLYSRAKARFGFSDDFASKVLGLLSRKK